MNLSNYISETLLKNNINQVFSITGGFAMFLNDSFSKKLNVLYQHHEQACGYSAIGYTKTSSKMCVVCVTSGCGITNTITTILDAWQDSLPIIFICGQTKSKETVKYYRENKNLNMRNISGSDCDVIQMVKDITKYCYELENENDIQYHLNKAIYMANEGRKGPVLLSIPIDLQGKNLDFDIKSNFFVNKEKEIIDENKLDQIKEFYNNSNRPLILAGGSIRTSNKENEFKKFIFDNNIPSVFTFFSMDLLESNHNLYNGRIGIIGERCGNFVIQNCDFLLVVGSKLNLSHVGYNPKWFAREAKIIHIDIDKNELEKNIIDINISLRMDLKDFLENINLNKKNNDEWIAKCNHWKKLWFQNIPDNIELDNKLNPYYVIKKISDLNKFPTNYIANSGTTITTAWHILSIKQNDRFIVTHQGDMGFEIPGGIGSCLADKEKQSIVLIGDGALQLNIQELETIKRLNYNIKIFVFNNNGYCCIRNTQENYFQNIAGCDKESNLSFPNLKEISKAYNINYTSINSSDIIDNKLTEIFEKKHPIICEIYVFDQERYPKLGAIKNEDGTFTGRPFEDMKPFLDRNIFEKEMIIKPLKM